MRRALAAILLLPAIAAVLIGWHYANRILGPDAPPGRTGQLVFAHTDSTVTLDATPKARRAGEWAMEWPGGFGRIGPIVEEDAGRVVTRLEVLGGAPPDTTARLAGFAPDADPFTWLGFAFEIVEVPARIGALPAWLVPGRDSTWAIFVHGRAANRAEVLRMLPAYVARGLPCLVIAYRNDRDGPRVGDGGYRFGATEWEDVEDAVRWARARGARDVVLVGCSMGGGIVMHFLRKSDVRALARAAVLDAPALDWSGIIRHEARRGHVPEPVTRWGQWVASVRTGLRWDDLSQIAHAAEFATPMLVFHGDADGTVPVGQSEAFARARSDLVTLHVFPGAGHVESANVDADRYVAALDDWLGRLGVGTADTADAAVAR